MDYATIQALPAEAYLNPETFRTMFDGIPSNVAERDARYADALKVSTEAAEVSISVRGTWSASMLDGSSLQSYEGIGYHANTAAVLQGFLDGPAALVVYRLTPDGVSRAVVKPRT